MKPAPRVPLQMQADMIAAYTRKVMRDAGREVRAQGPYRLDAAHEVKPILTRREAITLASVAVPFVGLCVLGIWKLAEIIGGA